VFENPGLNERALVDTVGEKFTEGSPTHQRFRLLGDQYGVSSNLAP
jgi:hypothetical protein